MQDTNHTVGVRSVNETRTKENTQKQNGEYSLLMIE